MPLEASSSDVLPVKFPPEHQSLSLTDQGKRDHGWIRDRKTWSYMELQQKNKTGTVLQTCQKINTAQDSTLPSCLGSQPWGKDGQRIGLSILSILNIRLGSVIWLRTGARTSGLQWRENTKRLQLEHTIESWMHAPLTLPHKSIKQIGGKIDQYRG